jgi:hypothetical protein
MAAREKVESGRSGVREKGCGRRYERAVLLSFKSPNFEALRYERRGAVLSDDDYATN